MSDRYSSEADQPFLKSREWRERIRPQQLSRQPICEHCNAMGKTEAATQVDHIRRPHGDKHLQRSATNLQSLCAQHHLAKSNWERKGDGKPMLLGYDASGWPIMLKDDAVERQQGSEPSYTIA